MYVQSFLQSFSTLPSTNSTNNLVKIHTSELTFFCEFLVPPELLAKFQRSRMICEAPPLSMSVRPSVRPPQKRYSFVISASISIGQETFCPPCAGFSPTRPHWAELVIESPCPCVCLCVCAIMISIVLLNY